MSRLIEDPTPGYQLIYDERWGGSPLLVSVLLLAGGLLVATTFALIAQNVRLYTPEMTLHVFGERFARYMWWGFATVFLSIAVWGAIAADGPRPQRSGAERRAL